MNRFGIIAVIAVIAAGAAPGCVRPPVRAEQVVREGPLTVTWEFSRSERDAEPYTEAKLVINGNNARRYLVGVFYGKVRKILSPAEINPEMVGGTLSGFVTVNNGRGSEVIVRYNEQEMMLIVAERMWSDSLPPDHSGS